MALVDRLMVILTAHTGQFNTAMKAAGVQALKTAQKIKTAHMLIAGAVGFALVKSIAKFATFERKMVTAGAVANATSDELAAMTAVTRQLGRDSEWGASKAADAMKFMGMAGMTAQEQMGSLEHVLNLATAAELEVGRAADITTNIMRGFGLETSELAATNDILVKTLTSSNTNLEQLGQAFKFAGPLAKQTGMRMEELAAIFGKMGNAALQSGQAGRAMRMGLMRMAKPTKEGARALRELGVEIYNDSGGMRNFIEILADLKRSGAGIKSLQEIFGVRHGSALIHVVEQADGALQEYVKTIDAANGATKELVKAKLDTVSGQWNMLKASWEDAAISLGMVFKGPAKAVMYVLRKLGNVLAAVFGYFAVVVNQLINAWPVFVDIFELGVLVCRKVLNQFMYRLVSTKGLIFGMIKDMLDWAAQFPVVGGVAKKLGAVLTVMYEESKESASIYSDMVKELNEEIEEQKKVVLRSQAVMLKKNAALRKSIQLMHERLQAETNAIGSAKQMTAEQIRLAEAEKEAARKTELFNSQVEKAHAKIEELLNPASQMTFDELQAAAPKAAEALKKIQDAMVDLMATEILSNDELAKRAELLGILKNKEAEYLATIKLRTETELAYMGGLKQGLEEQAQTWANLTTAMSDYLLTNVIEGRNATERWEAFNQMMIRGLKRWLLELISAKVKEYAISKLYAMKGVLLSAGEGAAAAGKEAAKKVPFPANLIVIPAVIGAIFAGIYSMSKKFHTGGVFEASGPTLPGLGPSEGVAILQDGEEIIPRGGSGGSGVTVNYNAVFPQTELEVDNFVDEMLVPALKRRQLAGAF